MSNLRNKLTLCLMLSALNACATGLTDRVTVVNDYCRIAKPIPYDGVRDTPDTRNAVEAHNSEFVCVCEHDCPKGVK